MYERFFRFEYRPFVSLPGASGIFWTNGHRNALSVLELGLNRLSPVTVLTGGTGTGKTTLIQQMMLMAAPDRVIGLISGFASGRGDLLQWVLAAFGLDASPASESELNRRLLRHFADQLAQDRRCVLVIDEAQNLSPGDLDTLRRLGNLDTSELLLLLVLVGQPELRAKLAHSDNRRICQRIAADYHLEPMTADETGRYVRHKLAQAGGSEDVFDGEALDEIHRVAGGVPLKINQLCDRALNAACSAHIRQVSRSIARGLIEGTLRQETHPGLPRREIEVDGAGAKQGREAGDSAPPASAAPTRQRGRGLGLVRGNRSPEKLPAGKSVPVDGGNLSIFGGEHLDVPPQIFGFASWSDDIWDFVEDSDGPPSMPASDDLEESAVMQTGARSRPALKIPSPLPGKRNDAALPDPAPVDQVSGPRERLAERPGARSPERPVERRPVRPAAAAADALVEAHQAAPPAACAIEPGPQDAKSAARAVKGIETAAPAAGGGEAALRRAFSPSGGWRWRWRHAASVAALAAGGSIAATIAVAFLPDLDGGLARQAEPAMRWSETPTGPEELAQATVAPGPATLQGGRAGTGIQPADRLEPSTPRPTTVERGGKAPDAPVQVALSTDGMTPFRAEASARRASLAEVDLLAAAPPRGVTMGTSEPGASEAEALFLRALELAIHNPRAAVVDYARAALAGHARAAYYLGQIYETGDGVPVDFALAGHWYGRASANNSRSQGRLAQLPKAEGGELAPPLPLLAQRGNGRDADFVWTSGPGADPVSYVVELSDDLRAGANRAVQVSGSAARLPLAATTSHWRVLAVDASGERSALSDWRPIARAVPATPDELATPRPARIDPDLQPPANPPR